MKKYYTFLDENGKRITEIEAKNHDEAVKLGNNRYEEINFSTDFEFEMSEED